MCLITSFDDVVLSFVEEFCSNLARFAKLLSTVLSLRRFSFIEVTSIDECVVITHSVYSKTVSHVSNWTDWVLWTSVTSRVMPFEEAVGLIRQGASRIFIITWPRFL